MPGPLSTLPARLFIADESLRLDSPQLQDSYPEIEQIRVPLATLRGLTVGQLVGRFGCRSAEALLRSLSDRELGRLVRGAWGRLDLETVGLASRLLSEFHLSTRTKNCLVNAEISTLGQLAGQTDNGLLHISNFGRKCLAEVVDLLDLVGLRLSMSEEELADPLLQPPRDSVIDLTLLWPIERLQFTESLNQQLANLGFVCVADIATLSVEEASLIDPRIQERLLQMGLNVGMEMPSWQRAQLVGLQKFFAKEVADPPSTGSQQPIESVESVECDTPSPSALTVEDELREMAARVTSERDAQIVCRYLGWDGRGGATLEQVGKEVSLTRERVRQVQDRVLRKLKESAPAPTVLTGALNYVREAAPAEAEEIERGLQATGLSSVQFQLETLLSATEACGLSVPFSIESVGGFRFVAKHDLPVFQRH